MDKSNKEKKKLIVKVVASLVASAFVLTVSTFSWFTHGDTASAGSIGVNVADTIEVNASTDGNEFGGIVHIDLGNKGKLTEYSSDGKYFYKPSFGPTGEVAYYVQVEKNAKEHGFVEFSFFIQSYDQFELYLDEGSTVTPADSTRNQDNIVGAIRVAFINKVNDMDRIIWIPNTRYEYEERTSTVNKNGKVEDKYYFACCDKAFPSNINSEKIVNTDIYEVFTNGQENGYDNKSRQIVWGDIDKNMPIKPIFKTTPETKVTNEIIVRIWVEGTDREAKTALIGGKFNFNFKFRAVAAK